MNAFNDPPVVFRWFSAFAAVIMFLICAVNLFSALSCIATGRATYTESYRGIVTKQEEVTKEKEPKKYNDVISQSWAYATWTGVLCGVFFYFFRKIE